MLRCACSGSLRSPLSASIRRLSLPRSSNSVPPSRLLYTSTPSTLRPRASPSSNRPLEQRRWISDEQHFRTRFGNLKVNLVSSFSTSSLSLLSLSPAERCNPMTESESSSRNCSIERRETVSQSTFSYFHSSTHLSFPFPPRYQEDAYSVHSLAIPRNALKWNVMDDRMGAGWNPTLLEGFDGEAPGSDEDMKRQVAFFGVYDG